MKGVTATAGMKRVEAVLYLVRPEAEAKARQEMEQAGGRPRRGARGKDWMVIAAGGLTYQFRIVDQLSAALELLAAHYFNFVVLDDRVPGGNGNHVDCLTDSMAQAFMQRVHYSADPEKMYPLARIIAVLDDDACLADRAFAMGRWRIGGYVVDPFGVSPAAPREMADPPGALFSLMHSVSGAEQDPGKSALCLSGGGLEGFLFEVGVLKAINAHLQNRSITDFDIFCGISAGSILAAFLANTAEPEQIARALTGNGDAGAVTGMEVLSPRIIFDPHVREYLNRVAYLVRQAPVTNISSLFSTALKTIPTGFFRGDNLRAFVERILTQDGRTNDFRELKKELYIGATEQDTSNHTIFGAGQWRDIPISTAVRASCALTPFYEPEKIRGRYYVDGQYTRTSNFHFAIERGAKLVIVVDPLVPIKVEQPGYVQSKGGVFAALQALKAVIHTRFMHGIRHAAENNPDVDFVLFAPEAEDMKLMSGSPMKYNIRTEILNMAYRCTVRKVQRDFEILSGTFEKHGYRLQRHPRLRMTHTEVY